MITPHLQDDDLLRDISTAPPAEDCFHLWWLGQSGFLIRWGERFLLIDPYLSESLTEKYSRTDKPHIRMTGRPIEPGRFDFIDLVSSSHNHTDHLDADTLKPLIDASPGMEILIPEANRDFVAERLGVDRTSPRRLEGGERALSRQASNVSPFQPRTRSGSWMIRAGINISGMFSASGPGASITAETRFLLMGSRKPSQGIPSTWQFCPSTVVLQGGESPATSGAERPPNSQTRSAPDLRSPVTMTCSASIQRPRMSSSSIATSSTSPIGCCAAPNGGAVSNWRDAEIGRGPEIFRGAGRGVENSCIQRGGHLDTQRDS